MNNKYTKPEAFADWDEQLERMRAGGRDAIIFSCLHSSFFSHFAGQN
jgi:hypothetical protein